MNETRWATVIRSIARVWSLLSIGFVLLIFIGEAFSDTTGPGLVGIEWVLLTFFPVGVFAGLILAWRWELQGGMLTTISIAAFYVIEFLRSGNWAGGPWFLLIAFPGFLFLLLGIAAPPQQHRFV